MKWLVLTVVFLQVSTPSNDREAAQGIKDGNRLYKAGNMAEAEQAYDKAINSQYKYIALINKGNALYRQKKFEEAIKTYRQTAAHGNENLMVRSAAYYNAGVVYSSQKQIEESIEEYKNALRLNWKDAKARENLQKALLELKKKSGGGGDDKNNQPPKQSKSNISKSQAQQQLDRLEEKEKATQQKVTSKKGQYGGSAGKDW